MQQQFDAAPSFDSKPFVDHCLPHKGWQLQLGLLVKSLNASLSVRPASLMPTLAYCKQIGIILILVLNMFSRTMIMLFPESFEWEASDIVNRGCRRSFLQSWPGFRRWCVTDLYYACIVLGKCNQWWKTSVHSMYVLWVDSKSWK